MILLGMLRYQGSSFTSVFLRRELQNFRKSRTRRAMSDGRSLGTFQADNVVDARHVDAAATALAFLTTHTLDRRRRKGSRRKREPIDGDLGKV